MCRLRNIAMPDYQESVTTGQTDRQTDRQTDGQYDPYVLLCFNQATQNQRALTQVYIEGKSRKYRGVVNVKSREKTRQVRDNLSQQLEHKSPKGRTEPGVREGKRSLLKCHTRCKCSMETTRYSVKVKLCIRVIK